MAREVNVAQNDDDEYSSIQVRLSSEVHQASSTPVPAPTLKVKVTNSGARKRERCRDKLLHRQIKMSKALVATWHVEVERRPEV